MKNMQVDLDPHLGLFVTARLRSMFLRAITLPLALRPGLLDQWWRGPLARESDHDRSPQSLAPRKA
jgi:hypothetical protein